MAFGPGGCTEDRPEEVAQGAIWDLARGWSLHKYRASLQPPYSCGLSQKQEI